MRRAQSLFAKTSITLTIAFLIFLLFSSVVVAYYILVPVSKRAANDFASLIVISAQTWVELPPLTRPDFERELLDKHQLTILPIETPLEVSRSSLPYIRFLEEDLLKLTGTPIYVQTQQGGDGSCFCIDMPVYNRYIRVSFSRERIGAKPPLASLYIILGGTLLIIITTLLLVRRITIPLTRLSDATTLVGRGENPVLLPETGARELVTLTQHFNQMAKEISALLSNRTTLFAGISHDLRTPITRMQLAVTMLNKQQDPDLVARLEHDLEEMTHLMTDTLDLARGLRPHMPEQIDLQLFIDDVLTGFQNKDIQTRFSQDTHYFCLVDSHALRRVLSNLIDNALRYSEQRPVEIQCSHRGTDITIQILDRGKGIPIEQREAVFRPFHRLETSRNKKTGGSGLGLTIVQQLCDVNRWQLQIHARHGGGTVVEIKLPSDIEQTNAGAI